MKEEYIQQNAAEYVYNFQPTGVITEDRLKCYLAGAHSRDEEITRLSAEIEDDNYVISKLREELDQLRNPWISVKDRLPEEPLTICAVWLKGDDLTPYISLYDNGLFLLVPVDATVTHWMPIPEMPKGGEQ